MISFAHARGGRDAVTVLSKPKGRDQRKRREEAESGVSVALFDVPADNSRVVEKFNVVNDGPEVVA